MLRFCSTVLAVLATLTLISSEGSATTIAFEVADLPDAEAGVDLWQYTYTVSGFTLGAAGGFTILFELSEFDMLEDPPPFVHSDWDVIVLQPDLGLNDPGWYDALALVDSPTLTDQFVVSFAFLGTGSPGSQPFEIFDSNFDIVETGFTVPEPTTATLLALGLIAMCCNRRSQRTG